MGGIIGRLFREFAVTLAAAIGVSAVLSLTLTPMMAAYLLKPEPPHESRGRLYKLSERGLGGRAARPTTAGSIGCFAHQRTTLLATLATVALTAWLAVMVPKGFFPQQDTGSSWASPRPRRRSPSRG
jgi:multidrug efflux pump subunit AcrB